MNPFSELTHNWPLVLSCVVLILLAALARYKRGYLLESTKVWKRILGHSLRPRLFLGLLVIIMLTALIDWNPSLLGLLTGDHSGGEPGKLNRLLFLALLLCINAVVISFAKQWKRSAYLANARIMDSANFWYQSIFVFFVGVAMVECILILEINSSNFMAYALVAALCGWIFQDIIKGILAYYHMHSLDMLHVGDWIQVPNKGIDGSIIDFSLVNVKVRNWDGTISTLPTSSLQTEHLVNNQNMLKGETTGRRMLKTFLIDTTSIRRLDEREVEDLKARVALEDIHPSTFDGMERPVLNLQMFRLYLHEWLKECVLVNRKPRLLVRLQDQTPTGYPLQVYIFLLSTALADFERDQSFIIEHILGSMGWFGLRVYQAPTNINEVTVIDGNDKHVI